MGIIYDEEYFKPLQCSKCGSRNIATPVNERNVELRCLDCGHEKRAKPTPVSDGTNAGWHEKKNPNPYREF